MSSSIPSSQLTKTKHLLQISRGIIFDFDGLLADSEPYHYLAYNEVFQRYGHSLNKDEYWVEWTSKGKGIAGEIRHDLVNKFRNILRDGTYSIKSDEIADKIVQKVRDNKNQLVL